MVNKEEEIGMNNESENEENIIQENGKVKVEEGGTIESMDKNETQKIEDDSNLNLNKKKKETIKRDQKIENKINLKSDIIKKDDHLEINSRGNVNENSNQNVNIHSNISITDNDEMGIKEETEFTKETISKHESSNESNYQIEKKINLQKPIDNDINQDEKKDNNYSGQEYHESDDDDDNDNDDDDDDDDDDDGNDSDGDYDDEEDGDGADELRNNSKKKINLKAKIFKRQKMKNKPNNEIKVLIITTDQDTTRIKNVIKSIKCTGIGSVAYINDQTPKFEKIRKYDSIFVYSEINTPFSDSKRLGDTLADYLEDGGGIVLCTYRALIYPSSRGRGSELMGRIVHQYLPIQTGKLIGRGNIGIGKRLIQDHQILNNVTTFHAGHLSSRIEIKLSHPTTNVQKTNNSLQKVKSIKEKDEERIGNEEKMQVEKNIENKNENAIENENEDENINEKDKELVIKNEEEEKSIKAIQEQTPLSKPQIIVEWEDGIPLAIVRPGNEDLGTIVVLNLWPVSGDGYPSHSKWLYWDPKTDGSFILANSVEYVAKN
ncbi:hypothetical protein M0813_17976 [Anaeramoeba flamelloides]|uniref:Uncharacterized protein n=1 Tax=Anaeramoeba flamelloides TaxID=1746091 RepID=A0ABQ8YV89_9EUKA|nr:hypothetical protein M0813_17976 [Anaeramoeba flamelloides]